jgi:ABC-2 type transport system permease protein
MRLPESARTVYLISRREFLTRVRSRFFIVGTVLFMAALAGYIVLQATVLGRVTPTFKIAFVGDAQVLAQPMRNAASAENVRVDVRSVPDLATGESQVRSGTLDVLVSGDAAAPDVAVKDQLDPAVGVILNALVKQVALNRALVAAGSDPAAVEGKVASANIHSAFLDPNAGQRNTRQIVGIFVAVLLYVTLLIYGQLVASGVVEEKANRIIEILLSTVRPRQLLLGKVIGIGLVGLFQLTLLGAAALITTSRLQVISVPDVGIVSVLAGLFWFVLGFVFYALIYAAGGSMVSRQEDLGSVTGPLAMLIVGTYLAFFWVLANPDNPIAVGLSILPPFAPILMPARIATGEAQGWQVIIAAILAVAAIVGLNALAARIYSNSVMRIGSRVRLIEAWRGRP